MSQKSELKKQNGPWRFFRSQLETIVWDKERQCVMADFSKGHFTTEDPRTAAILRSMGYPDIPLELESPPQNVLVMQAAPPVLKTTELPEDNTNEALRPGKGKVPRVVAGK